MTQMDGLQVLALVLLVAIAFVVGRYWNQP